MRRTNQQPPLGSILNKSHPLSRGLVSCLIFNEGGGKIVRDSFNSRQDGVLSGGAVFTNKQIGGVGDFLTSTSSVATVPIFNFFTGKVTIAAWVYYTSTPNYGFIIYSPDFYLAIDSLGRLDDYVQESNTTTRQTGGLPTLTVNTWYHVALTYDGGTQTIWVNGVPSGTLSWTGTTNNTTTSFGVGNYPVAPSATYTIKGYVKDVMIYNRGLSATEIRQLYSNNYSMFLPPQQGYGSLTVLYTRNDETSLPSDDTNLDTSYSAQDIIDVATQDSVYVDQSATGNYYAIHQFKNDVSTNTSCILTWKGKSNQATSISTAYLQIYNRNTTTWDTVDTDTTTAANTDFTLTGSVPSLTDYKDGSNIISCRVYQRD